MFPNPTSASVAKHRDPERSTLRVVPATDHRPIDWLDQWNGPAVSTATAVGALVLSEQHGGGLGEIDAPNPLDSAYQGDLSELIVGSMHWLARQQHADGGWTSQPCDLLQPSELFTSMFVRAAFQLTGAPAAYPDLGSGMVSFTSNQGTDYLKSEYGALHSASLLAYGCSALAEVVDWKHLPTIPLERATFGVVDSRVEFWKHRDPVLPAIVALGVAAYSLHKPLNPITLWRRGRACASATDWLASQQNPDGSFENSVPTTSLVLMSLASIGQNTGHVVRHGVEYLLSQVGANGSWNELNWTRQQSNLANTCG